MSVAATCPLVEIAVALDDVVSLARFAGQGEDAVLADEAAQVLYEEYGMNEQDRVAFLATFPTTNRRII